MQPAQQALIDAAHLEAAVLDAIGDDTLTVMRIRQPLFPSNDDRSAGLVPMRCGDLSRPHSSTWSTPPSSTAATDVRKPFGSAARARRRPR